jgi:endonuclease-8
MPEGDTIFRAARTLHRALAGRTVTRFESVYPALTRVDRDRPVAGRRIESVSARGKHLLMTFSGNLILHTHQRMNGSWHIYRAGERWKARAIDMRIRLDTAAFQAVGFNIPVAEFLTADELARHDIIQSLGPDLTDPAFDREEVRRRMLAHPEAPLHDLLLDQRVIAGIGNVLKSEVLFVARINPFTRPTQVDPVMFNTLMDAAVRLMTMNIVESVRMTPAIGRRTTGSLDPSATLYVYGRGGTPCRRCGAIISARKTGEDARLTYWCPQCQPMP